MKRILVLWLFALLLSPGGADAKNYEASILRVYSHVQRPDYDAPWAGKSSERLTHMGVLVDPEHILVAAFAIPSARHFEVMKLGDSRPYPVELVFSDPAVDLALLRFQGDKPQGLAVMPLGEDLSLGSRVELYQGREGESLVATSLNLREVETRPIFLTGYSVPQYVLEIKRTGFGWFEPLVRQNQMVGAAIAQAGSFIYALPASLIKRFLREAKRKSYRGFAELGFQVSVFTSPDLRRWAQASSIDPQSGAWIHSIDPVGAFASKLEEGDILLALNGEPVSSRGTYLHPRWGRLGIQAKLYELGAGDRLQLKILRRGKVQMIEAQAQRTDPREEKLVPALGEDPQYLIFGGLLFQELSKGLIESWGTHWRKRAPIFYLMEEAFASFGRSAARRVVLQRVFPLAYNKGYHSLENDFVTSINGQPVTHIGSVREALGQPEALASTYARIQLEPSGDEIILSYEGLDKVHSVLQQRYAIPASARFWQPSFAPTASMPPPATRAP